MSMVHYVRSEIICSKVTVLQSWAENWLDDSKERKVLGNKFSLCFTCDCFAQ